MVSVSGQLWHCLWSPNQSENRNSLAFMKMIFLLSIPCDHFKSGPQHSAWKWRFTHRIQADWTYSVPILQPVANKGKNLFPHSFAWGQWGGVGVSSICIWVYICLPPPVLQFSETEKTSSWNQPVLLNIIYSNSVFPIKATIKKL